MSQYVLTQKRSQAAFFAHSLAGGSVGYGGAAYRLPPKDALLNLSPDIRKLADTYFKKKVVVWHQHRNHGLSSQACCLNFLLPLATAPDVLARVVGAALGIRPPEMLEVERLDDQPLFVGFEWIGRDNYLNEASKSGHRSRGANATSADAVVRFLDNGRPATLLIEWKYTEAYGSPLEASGNKVRENRYKDLIFAPNGPIRADLGLKLTDFFWEPFYQMLRQQMLAFQMEKAREDGAEIVRVLHIGPAANKALHAVTAPALKKFGSDAYEVFRSLLVEDSRFIKRTIETVFSETLSTAKGSDELAWAKYLLERYIAVPASALG